MQQNQQTQQAAQLVEETIQKALYSIKQATQVANPQAVIDTQAQLQEATKKLEDARNTATPAQKQQFHHVQQLLQQALQQVQQAIQLGNE